MILTPADNAIEKYLDRLESGFPADSNHYEGMEELRNAIGCCIECSFRTVKKLFPMGIETKPVPFCRNLERVVTDSWYCGDFNRKEEE